MPENMRAAVINKIGHIEIETRPMPVPKAGEVLVKILYCGICGSDVHYYEFGKIGSYEVKDPIILGHECCGKIVKVGEAVRSLKTGDIVALEPGIPCGKCDFCRSGRYNLCKDVVFMATPPYDGAFAEYVSYPEEWAFKIPEGMNPMEGALIEPLAVGFHAARQGGACVGKSAVVLGSGCIGLMTLLSLKAMGMREIYMVDVFDNRLEKAKQLGAIDTLNASSCDVVQRIMELTESRGVDLVFETAGSEKTAQQTVDLVCQGGTIVLVGMSPDGHVMYNLGKLISKEASIKTVFRYRNIYPDAIKAVATGLIPLSEIVTGVCKFENVDDEMKIVIKEKSKVIKSVVEF